MSMGLIYSQLNLIWFDFVNPDYRFRMRSVLHFNRSSKKVHRDRQKEVFHFESKKFLLNSNFGLAKGLSRLIQKQFFAFEKSYPCLQIKIDQFYFNKVPKLAQLHKHGNF